MTTISSAKKSGEEFIRSVCANKTVLVFANIGVNNNTNKEGTQRQFIQHVGGYSPFQKNGQFYKAVAGPELAQQMRDNVDNVKFMTKMKSLGYTLEKDVLLFSDAYQCYNPSETILAMFSFISSLKKSQRLIFILQDENQVQLFSKFFIKSFIKLDTQGKVKNFMCTSLDSILKSVRSSVDIESLPSLQSSQEKKEKLSVLLGVRSDLLCVSLYESFCILIHQQEVLRSVMRSLLAITNENENKDRNSDLFSVKSEESFQKDPNDAGSDTTYDGSISREEDRQDSLLLDESETSKDENHMETELKENPSLLIDKSLVASQNRTGKDFFNPNSTLTMFVHPTFYENVKQVRKSSNPSSYTHLLHLECHIHGGDGETFRVALKPNNNLLKGDNINQEHFYEVKPNFTRYLCKDGSSLTCWTPKTTFHLLDSFITATRKKYPAKQFNLFVKEFETFKQLLSIPEFKEVLTRFDSIVTLYNNLTQSLARVPAISLSQMANYLNNILARDKTCVLHTELVSNVYSGSLL